LKVLYAAQFERRRPFAIGWTPVYVARDRAMKSKIHIPKSAKMPGAEEATAR